MLSELSLKAFLDKTASGTPFPGGGSMSAFFAASAAALTEMAANLTIGKKGFEAVQEEMKSIAAGASALRAKMTAAVDRDSEAFEQVMAAFRLPKNSTAEKESRNAAVQQAFKNAASVPMEVAEAAFEIMLLAQKVVAEGNKNAATDAQVGVIAARSAVLGSLCNVKVNLTSIQDQGFAEKLSEQVRHLEKAVIVSHRGHRGEKPTETTERKKCRKNKLFSVISVGKKYMPYNGLHGKKERTF
jgi:formiminotetrahydrofolate cyclodeaminase